MSEEPKTRCECPMATYCERHKINKTARMHELCQTRPDYFDAFDKAADQKSPLPEGQRRYAPATPCEVRGPQKTPEGITVEPPDYITRSANMYRAWCKWVAAGCPTRTPERIDELHQICLSCELYNPEAKQCNVCGCYVGGRKGWLNKLLFATERCAAPGAPKWLEEVT